ncbi:MAG: serine/threonine-protein phosphatase [bacterium]|nr:serine/threonine-protein phosphatase [bacterium]
MMGPELDLFGMTHPGRKRAENQDQFVVADLRKTVQIRQTSLGTEECDWLQSELEGYLLMVADGVGGHPGGEAASTFAVKSVVDYLLEVVPWFFITSRTGTTKTTENLKHLVERTNAAVRAAQDTQPEHPTMATTLTLACVLWPRLFVAHVGDSRCYLFRRDRLRQITADHTLAEELKARGDPKFQVADLSPLTHVVTQVIGGDTDSVAPDVYEVLLAPRDRLILCTDGLTDMVPEDVILDYVEETSSARELCENLVDAANEGGGRDNVTVVAMCVGGISELLPRED